MTDTNKKILKKKQKSETIYSVYFPTIARIDSNMIKNFHKLSHNYLLHNTIDFFEYRYYKIYYLYSMIILFKSNTQVYTTSKPAVVLVL